MMHELQEKKRKGLLPGDSVMWMFIISDGGVKICTAEEQELAKYIENPDLVAHIIKTHKLKRPDTFGAVVFPGAVGDVSHDVEYQEFSFADAPPVATTALV